MNIKADKEMHETMELFNTRPDSLTAIVKAKTDIKGQLGDLHIFSIDESHMDVAYYPPPKEERTTVRIDFNPPLSSMYDAKPRLRAWRDAIYARWNVPDRPTVYYYTFPPAWPYTVPVAILVAALLFTLYAPGRLADWSRELVAKYCGVGFLKYASWFAAAMHFVIEPIFLLFLTQRHKTPFVPRVKWILTNMALGYPALDHFRECVMYERLRVIYRKTDVGEIPAKAPDADLKAKKSE